MSCRLESIYILQVISMLDEPPFYLLTSSWEIFSAVCFMWISSSRVIIYLVLLSLYFVGDPTLSNFYEPPALSVVLPFFSAYLDLGIPMLSISSSLLAPAFLLLKLSSTLDIVSDLLLDYSSSSFSSSISRLSMDR